MSVRGCIAGILLTPALAIAQVATGEGLQVPVGRIFGAFFLCVVLAVVAALILRGRTLPGKWLPVSLAPKRIRVLESTRINLRTSLVLVAVDDRKLLLCVDPKGTSLMSDLSAIPSDVPNT